MQVRRKENIWSACIGFPPLQSFLQHALHFLSSYHHEFSLFIICRHIPQHHWSAVWWSWFQEVHVQAPLALECGVVGVDVMSSTVGHHNACLCVFAVRTISNEKIIGAYADSLVHTDLSKQLLSMKEYCEGTMGILISTLIRYATTPMNTATDRHDI